MKNDKIIPLHYHNECANSVQILIQKILLSWVLLHRNGDGGWGACSHFTAAWFKFIFPGLSDSRKFLRSRFSSECDSLSVLLHLSALLSEDGVAPDSALEADSPEVLSSPGMTPSTAHCHCEGKKCLDSWGINLTGMLFVSRHWNSLASFFHFWSMKHILCFLSRRLDTRIRNWQR